MHPTFDRGLRSVYRWPTARCPITRSEHEPGSVCLIRPQLELRTLIQRSYPERPPVGGSREASWSRRCRVFAVMLSVGCAAAPSSPPSHLTSETKVESLADFALGAEERPRIEQAQALAQADRTAEAFQLTDQIIQ